MIIHAWTLGNDKHLKFRLFKFQFAQFKVHALYKYTYINLGDNCYAFDKGRQVNKIGPHSETLKRLSSSTQRHSRATWLEDTPVCGQMMLWIDILERSIQNKIL